jgi:hypothetical protein
MKYFPIEIKFRNPSGKWGDLAQTAIRVVSPNRIHVEAKLPDGRSFSSSSAKEALDGGNGVRFKNIEYTHSERWATYVLWVTTNELNQIILNCEIAVEMVYRYDYRGAAGCAVTGGEKPWKFFCSEAVFDRVFTIWLSGRINYKMHPDKLEEVTKVLEPILLARKNRDGQNN